MRDADARCGPAPSERPAPALVNGRAGQGEQPRPLSLEDLAQGFSPRVLQRPQMRCAARTRTPYPRLPLPETNGARVLHRIFRVARLHASESVPVRAVLEPRRTAWGGWRLGMERRGGLRAARPIEPATRAVSDAHHAPGLGLNQAHNLNPPPSLCILRRRPLPASSCYSRYGASGQATPTHKADGGVCVRARSGVHLRPSGAHRAAYPWRPRRPGVSLRALPVFRGTGISGHGSARARRAPRRGCFRMCTSFLSQVELFCCGYMMILYVWLMMSINQR
jgi:hypothetical protein